MTLESTVLFCRGVVVLGLLCLFGCSARSQVGTKQPTVLLIVVDDLNDWVGFLEGHPQAHTPNMDRLTQRGVVFRNAHCQGVACNSSRSAFLLGRQPFSTGIYNNVTSWQPEVDNEHSLFQHFRRHGYSIHVSGKLIHRQGPDIERELFDECLDMHGSKLLNLSGLDFGNEFFDWGPLPEHMKEADQGTAAWIAERLTRPGTKPRLICWGLTGAHGPWYAPSRWLEHFPRDEIQLPRTREWKDVEFSQRARRIAQGRGEDAIIREAGCAQDIVRAYLACIAHVDEQIGKVIDVIDQQQLWDDTLIVLCSDHGMHFGEKGHWNKGTLWERTTRVPLVVVSPQHSLSAGKHCDRAVGLISLFATLSELKQLPIPEHVEGDSLVPLLEDPRRAHHQPAFTTLRSDNIAIRTDRYRLISYGKNGKYELYDYESDPDEWVNLAGDPRYQSVAEELLRQIPQDVAPMPARVKSQP